MSSRQQSIKANGPYQLLVNGNVFRTITVPVLDPGGHFKSYDLHKVATLYSGIEEMDAFSLNYWLSKFVMEVTKKSGERYPAKTIYGINIVVSDAI